MSDRIAKEFLQAAHGDLRATIHRMASVIGSARDRVDDAGESLGPNALQLLRRDLHPNDRWASNGATED